MNFQYINLSSINTSTTEVVPEIQIRDHTMCILNLSGVTENLFPLFLEIDWGDGVVDFHENNIYQSINLTEDRFSSVLLETFSHEYYPSDETTSKTLTATVTLKYINEDLSIFTIPISSTNYNFVESLEDIKLIGTDILISGEKVHKFLTKKDGYLVEIKTPTK